MIEYRVRDGTGLDLMSKTPRLITQALMHSLGNAVRATTIKQTSVGLDYTGRAFPAYSTRRMYVSLDHMPKPKGGRRVRLAHQGKPGISRHQAESCAMSDILGKRHAGLKMRKATGSAKKGTRLKTVAYDHGYLQYRVCMGRGAKPDLQFTGKMLAAFQIVQLTPKLVRLGFTSKEEVAKALGNITGQRGKSSKVVRPRRFIRIGPEHEKAIHRIMEEHVKRRFLIEDPNRVLVKRIA